MSNAVLKFLGIGNMLDREYRNVPTFQWARELVRNGVEADARVIELGVEWQGVAAAGVYRRLYADDGHGMTRDDLRDYMRTLGKGSKEVGGPHDNYALGCRMTLLPWNTEGVVVISMRDGDAFMVKMKYDPNAEGDGEYVLEEVEYEGEGGELHRATVCPPYFDDDLDLDWYDAIPDFVKEAGHGTVFVLLGRRLSDDTFDGDEERGESSRSLTRRYLNARFWDLPEGVTLRCLEFNKPAERAAWPKSQADTPAYQYRTIKGAKEFVEYVRRSGESTVEATGTVDLPDGTKAHWWLREPEVDTGGIGPASGFIACLYRGELYGHAYANKEDGDSRIGAAVYRQFGIGNDSVRRRVFVIIEPPEYDEVAGTPGVAPSTGRADLYWVGAGMSPRAIKPGDWAEEFAERMPTAIEKALVAAHEESTTTSEERQERLRRVMDRFSKRWRVTKARVAEAPKANTTTKPTIPGSAARIRPDAPPTGRRPRHGRKRVVIHGRSGTMSMGNVGAGGTPARTTHAVLGYPDVEWVTAEDIADEGMLAAWQPPSKTHPNGLVQLDETHPVVVGQIDYWQKQYAKSHALAIRDIVKDAYADVAIAKVSHVHALTGDVLSEEQRDSMLVNPALSASLFGLIGEDALITPRLGGLGAKRRPADTESPAEAVN